MKSRLVAAFEATSQGLSPDRVVADPELNLAFHEECSVSSHVESNAVEPAESRLATRNPIEKDVVSQ